MAEVGIENMLLFAVQPVIRRVLRRGRADIVHQARGHHDLGLDSGGKIAHVDIPQLFKDRILADVQRVMVAEEGTQLLIGALIQIHVPDALIVRKERIDRCGAVDARLQADAGLTFEIYHDDNSIHVVNPNEITARHLHLTHTPSQQIDSLDEAPSPIAKLLFEEEPQRLRQLEEAIRAQDWSREYEVVASAVNLLEITARGANKGGMVRRLAELLGVRQENVCCVGDHANDIPMLEYAGMAFAPENAIPAVHRVPGIRILPDCRENAMAAMIEILDRRYS